MTTLIVVLCIILAGIVFVQIGKLTELTAKIRGEKNAEYASNYWNSILGVIFMICFLLYCVWSAYDMKNYFLGFGPHTSASAHGSSLDSVFKITLFFTGIVFIITHVLLFWFTYKFHGREGSKAKFISHDNKLEVIWTAVPAIVMTFLVVGGLNAWNKVMADVKPDDKAIEIEATAYQFAWTLRYPGPDGLLGTKNYKLIGGANDIGQDWTDPKNYDDIKPDKLVLPVGQKVRIRIVARDVLHNFYLPQFRVKMDAVPGMPTYFVFTPTKTTEEYRAELKKYPEYNEPADPKDPNGKKRWEAFEYELACAELCGNGHFSMRREVKIVSQEEYNKWLSEQKSFYLTSIRNTVDDPNKGKKLAIDPIEVAKDTTKVIIEEKKEEGK